jgi:RHS repeat-associated protein
LWDTDAEYVYYAYGPLKRVSFGEDHIQAIDYVYTINGWLKGMNHQSLDAANDPGKDGASSSKYAKDVFGMTLAYFEGDFKRGYDSNQDGVLDNSDTYSVFNSEFTDASSPYYNKGVYQHDWYTNEVSSYNKSGATFPSQLVNYSSLYNGNITSISYNQAAASGSSSSFQFDGKPVCFMYNYDELYRLTQASFDYYDAATANWHRSDLTSGDYNVYHSAYDYDENGNITKLDRNTYNLNTQIDGLSYTYDSGTNKLNYITDSKTTSLTTDLENQSPDNYTYNEIGQLIGDDAEGIEDIQWMANGKIESVKYLSGKNIQFIYDALGNRVSKTVNNSGSSITTQYVYDANGNLMAVYDNKDGADYTLKELPLYANGRIGLRNETSNDDAYTDNGEYSRLIGQKQYELSDYLGNVREVVEDIKNTDGTAIVDVANDYYAFGMLLPGRNQNASDYRFAYQGKEHDDELKSNANSYDFGARIYDPRVGRWLSRDPLADQFPSESPYEAMGNDPVNRVDPDGREVSTVVQRDGDQIEIYVSTQYDRRTKSANGQDNYRYKFVPKGVDNETRQLTGNWYKYVEGTYVLCDTRDAVQLSQMALDGTKDKHLSKDEAKELTALSKMIVTGMVADVFWREPILSLEVDISLEHEIDIVSPLQKKEVVEKIKLKRDEKISINSGDFSGLDVTRKYYEVTNHIDFSEIANKINNGIFPFTVDGNGNITVKAGKTEITIGVGNEIDYLRIWNHYNGISGGWDQRPPDGKYRSLVEIESDGTVIQENR